MAACLIVKVGRAKKNLSTQRCLIIMLFPRWHITPDKDFEFCLIFLPREPRLGNEVKVCGMAIRVETKMTTAWNISATSLVAVVCRLWTVLAISWHIQSAPVHLFPKSFLSLTKSISLCRQNVNYRLCMDQGSGRHCCLDDCIWQPYHDQCDFSGPCRLDHDYEEQSCVRNGVHWNRA